MPTYTFECPKCKRVVDESITVSAYEGGYRPHCRCARAATKGGAMKPVVTEMERIYRAPEVRGDAFRFPKLCSHLNALDGDPAKSPTFTSRSEEKKYLAAHNERFGTKYEY
jgi:hypothetical protein